MIALLLSPVGRGIGIAALVLLSVFAIGRTGYNMAARQCQAEALRADLAAARQDLEIARRSASEAQAIAEANDAAARTNMERVRELEQAEAAKPAAKGCPGPSSRDYDRLRRIR